MKENVGRKEQVIRGILGPMLMAIGYTKLGGGKGRPSGLAAIVLGTALIESAITRVCPMNAMLGVDTRRKRGRESWMRQALEKVLFTAHRKNLMELEGETTVEGKPAAPKQLSNFGKNVHFSPDHFYTPKSEGEVLTILNRHAKGRIRGIGSLHSWNGSTVSEEVIVDMRHFDGVKVEQKGEENWATVGAGCRLDKLIGSLHKQAGVTLPTVPAITEQTIAGAISTGTHGSGMPSMSHFIEEVRLAAYDPQTGEARIYEWTEGPELRAVRCGLGCTGVLLSVRFRCVPDYSVLQNVSRVKTIEEALASEGDFPLQQTVLIPYVWDYFVYQRRALHGRKIGATGAAYLFRAHWLVIIDVLFHTFLLPIVNVIRSRKLARWYLKKFTPMMIWTAPPHIDDSAEVLVLEHELFSHLEMELIIPAGHIREAAKLLQEVISLFAGDTERTSPQFDAQLESIGMLDKLYRHRGTYFHHYPLLFRRILPDDALISMTSASEEPYYSISVFTYCRDRSRMFPMADFLAHSMNRLYGARLHWGKHFPLNNTDIEPLYPHLKEFREICNRIDPKGVFRNNFTRRVLGFDDL